MAISQFLLQSDKAKQYLSKINWKSSIKKVGKKAAPILGLSGGIAALVLFFPAGFFIELFGYVVANESLSFTKGWLCKKLKRQEIRDEELKSLGEKLRKDDFYELSELLSKKIQDEFGDEFADGIKKALQNEEVEKFFRDIVGEEIFSALDDELKKLHQDHQVMFKELYKVTKINILKIEDILKKTDATFATPRFFRPSGPEWVDFKNEYVCERTEVNEIIKKFLYKKVVMITGKPASGKSVILRNIGYKLAKKDEDIYIIELKRDLPDKQEVFKLQDCFLFIDDAHIDLEYVDSLVMKLLKNNVNILISTRSLEERFGPRDPSDIPTFLEDAIEIEAYDIVEGIIEKFSEKRKEIPQDIKEKLIKNDLWVLAWKLEAYDRSSEIDESAVYNRIKTYIEKDLKSTQLKELKLNKAENVFLPLSVFYRYEIPVRYRFVQYFAEQEDIEKLVKLNEINKVSKNDFDYLTMHHSEIAEIFLAMFQQFTDFAYEARNKIGGDLINGLFHKYFYQVPEECCLVISRTNEDTLKELLQTENTINEILKGINHENSAKLVGQCIYKLHHVDDNKTKKILEKSLKTIKDIIEANRIAGEVSHCFTSISKVDDIKARELLGMFDLKFFKDIIESDRNSAGIGHLLFSISRIDDIKAGELLGLFDLKFFKDIIESDRNSAGINYCLTSISRIDDIKARELLGMLDLKFFKDIIESDRNSAGINYCLTSISRIDDIKARELLGMFDLKFFKDIIESDRNSVGIGHLLSSISRIDDIKARELLGMFDLKFFKDIIESDRNSAGIDHLLSSISRIDDIKARELLGMFDLKFFKDIIESDRNSAGINYCLSSISKVDDIKARELLGMFDLKFFKDIIESDRNSVGIGHLLSSISRIDDIKARELLGMLDLKFFKDIIESDRNSAGINYCLTSISKVDDIKARELLGMLDLKLFKDIIETDNIQGIGEFINIVSKLDKQKANKIVNILDLEIVKDKIEKESNLSVFNNCIYNIFDANRNEKMEEILIDKRKKFVGALDIKKIKEMIENEDYLNNSWFIGNLEKWNRKKAMDVVALLDINTLKKQIERDKRVKNIGFFIYNIYKINPEKAKKLVSILDIDKLCKKIMWEKSLENINICIYNIRQVNPEKCKEIFYKLDMGVMNKYKIEKEDQINNIGLCVYNIDQVNPEMAQNLLMLINPRYLKDKIEIEEDIAQIGRFISTLFKIVPDKGRGILHSVFNSLIEKAKKEKNYEKLGDLISYISRIDLTMSLEVFNLLDSGLQNEVKKEIKTRIIPKLEEEIEKQPEEKEKYLGYIKILETFISRVDK